MIEKGVKAPLTYNPGKGRPKEHLAYLNKGEMKALRLLNGNNMERGPEGLPSFPPADAKGSSSKASSTKSSSSVSRISGGTAGSNAAKAAATKTTTRAPAASAAAAKASASKTSTASKGSSSVSRISGGTAGSNAARSALSGGGGARDSGQAANRSVSQSRSLTQSVAKPSATKTLNVGPMGTPVRVPSVRGPQIRSMPNIEPPTGPMPQSIKNLIESASYLLDPNDPTLARRTIASTEPAPTFGEALSNLSMRDFTKGLYDLGIGGIKGAIDVAYDPYGSLKRGIGAFDNYVRDQFGNIISGSEAAMLGPGYGDPDAIGRGFGAALNIPIAAGLASQFAPAPLNSVGMFVGPNASQRLKDAYQIGRQLALKGASNEDIFNETAKLTGPGVSGLQNIPKSPYWGYEVSAPMNLREGLFKPSGPIKAAENYVFGTRVEGMPTLGKISDTGALTYMYGGDIPRTPVTQLYSPYQRGFYPSDGRRISGGYDPNTDIMEINEAASRGMLSGFAKNYTPDEFRKTLIHEGQHKIAKLDPVFVPQGTNNEALLRFYQKSGVTPPPIEDIRGPSRDVYLGNKGEILARLSEQRADIPASQMKDYGTRITAQNKEWDRVNAAQKAYQDALKDISLRRYSSWGKISP